VSLLLAPHCKENPIYVFLFWELHGLSPNFHIHVAVSYFMYYQDRSLRQNKQTDPGISRIGKFPGNIKISHRYMFWKQQFHFWEYINGTRHLYWIPTCPSFAVHGHWSASNMNQQSYLAMLEKRFGIKMAFYVSKTQLTRVSVYARIEKCKLIKHILTNLKAEIRN
jgi:hypothetical protein